ncbi:MAG: hypothetical protein J3Q66DRAFT_428837 [Benniella sp.]|nr:MAG: hypothetical protein J3Q66DRAFT_428837 [Benniella sp.]
MKFSLIVAASAIAFAARSHYLFSKKNGRGDCRYLSVPDYDTCYKVSVFSKVKSVRFLNKDPNNTGITVYFYESEHCDEEYTNMPGIWPTVPIPDRSCPGIAPTTPGIAPTTPGTAPTTPDPSSEHLILILASLSLDPVAEWCCFEMVSQQDEYPDDPIASNTSGYSQNLTSHIRSPDNQTVRPQSPLTKAGIADR